MFEIHKLLNCVRNKEELPEQWKASAVVLIYKNGNKADCNNYQGISLLSTTHKVLPSICLSRLTPYIDEVTGDHQCVFQRYHLLIRYSAFKTYWRKRKSTIGLYISYL
jgi:hypothetical protein